MAKVQNTKQETQIQSVDDMPQVKELLTRQSDLARQLAEVEKQIEAAARSEGFDAQVQGLIDGKPCDASETLSGLIRSRDILRQATTGLDGRLRMARQQASEELIRQNTPEIESVKLQTGRALLNLRDALVSEHELESKLRLAGAMYVDTLFPTTPGFCRICPQGMANHPDNALVAMARLRGL